MSSKKKIKPIVLVKEEVAAAVDDERRKNNEEEDSSISSPRVSEEAATTPPALTDQSSISSDTESIADTSSETSPSRNHDESPIVTTSPTPSSTSSKEKHRADGKLIPRLVIPHVIKDDIRLRYPTMISNIYNSCDLDLTTSYLNKYYRPDFIAVQQLYGSFPSKLKGRMEIHGLPTFGKYWFERMNDFPDVMFSIKEYHVDVLSDDTGVIRCKFHLSGTQILPVQEPVINGTEVVTKDETPVYIIGEKSSIHIQNPIDYEDAIQSRLLFNNGNLDPEKSCDQIFEKYLAACTLVDGDEEDGDQQQIQVPSEVPNSSATDKDNIHVPEEETDISSQSIEYKESPPSITSFPKYRKLDSVMDEYNIPIHEEIIKKEEEELLNIGNTSESSSAQHLVQLNVPASSAITTMKVGFDGIVSLHFDVDSRIFLTEFYLFGNEDENEKS